ncbi:hypothetical protein RR46_00425 [Papilio xuthus]|uniref:Uncharacterized protein n=1 Tax=Papilio xuthus TaxID=66420 RepID=A0A0N0PAS2_PAPXU|nr:hypothetical protein RR46_00425 [Papilio xuthus]
MYPQQYFPSYNLGVFQFQDQQCIDAIYITQSTARFPPLNNLKYIPLYVVYIMYKYFESSILEIYFYITQFHRAVRLYQISHPTEKRSSLKLLQNFRAVNQKIRSFIMELPGRRVVSRTSAPIDNEEEEIHDKKDIRYLKELIKNLG